MSMTTDTLSNMASSYRETRQQYEAATAAIQAEVKPQVDAYNHVVTHTLAKFQSDYALWAAVSTKLLLPTNAIFVNYMPVNQEYVFESNGKQFYVPAFLLRNDPITVAMYTRKFIRKQQKANMTKAYEAANDAALKANRELKQAEKKAHEMAIKRNEHSVLLKRKESYILEHLNKKSKAKTM